MLNLYSKAAQIGGWEVSSILGHDDVGTPDDRRRHNVRIVSELRECTDQPFVTRDLGVWERGVHKAEASIQLLVGEVRSAAQEAPLCLLQNVVTPYRPVEATHC